MSGDAAKKVRWLQSSLLFPELTSYRGGWFTADTFDAKVVDDWFAQDGLSVAQIERVCSHIHILEDGLFETVLDGAATLEDVRILAGIVTDSWQTWALQRHGVELEVFVDAEEDQTGVIDYVISFQSKQA